MTPLHISINNKIQYYLTHDNPVRKTRFQKFAGLFSHSGSKGRARAKAYQLQINKMEDPAELEQKLLDDVLGARELDKSSINLRRRLAEGLCEHLQIDLGDLRREAEVNVANYYSSAEYGACTGIDVQMEYERLIFKSIQEKTHWSDTKRTDKEINHAAEMYSRISK